MDIEKTIAAARELGIANNTKIRNLEIRKEFREMRNNFWKYDDAIWELSRKYYLSISSIQQIIKDYKNVP